jgi:hypothetical protein
MKLHLTPPRLLLCLQLRLVWPPSLFPPLITVLSLSGQRPTREPEPDLTRTSEPIIQLPKPATPSTKWGPFDSGLSQPATSSSQRYPTTTPFSSPSVTEALPPPQPSFSFFSPQLRSSNSNTTSSAGRYGERHSLSQATRRSGQYGAFIDDDQEDEDPSLSSSSPFTQGAASSHSHRTTSANSSSHSRQSLPHQQPHQEILFHAKTSEVDEAKRLAKEAVQWRINQRLQHK